MFIYPVDNSSEQTTLLRHPFEHVEAATNVTRPSWQSPKAGIEEDEVAGWEPLRGTLKPDIATSDPQGEPTLRVASSDGGWNETLQEEFDELVEKHALETLSPENKSRLERLRVLRRQLRPTRSADEILRDHLESKALRDLLRAYTQYVHIIRT